jgi:hypothetical protein
MTAIQNSGLAFFPMLVGSVQDSRSIHGTRLQYTVPLLIFISCGCVSALLTVLLIIVDARRGNRLNASGAEKQTWGSEQKRLRPSIDQFAEPEELPSALHAVFEDPVYSDPY